jgi:hypothetical protein
VPTALQKAEFDVNVYAKHSNAAAKESNLLFFKISLLPSLDLFIVRLFSNNITDIIECQYKKQNNSPYQRATQLHLIRGDIYLFTSQ